MVLGMHRSGTSAVMGALNILGLRIGTEVIAANEYNPKGYFEHSGVISVNENILTILDSSWDDLFPLPHMWWHRPHLQESRIKIREILEREMKDSSRIGIKDPRLCRLLPLWLEVLHSIQVDPVFIIPIRNPIETANSLQRRDGFSTEKALLLWMSHMLDAELNTRGFKRIFIFYDEFIKATGHVITLIDRALDLGLHESFETNRERIASFLDASMRHSVADDDQLKQVALPEIYDFYRELCDVVREDAGIEKQSKKMVELRSQFYDAVSFYYNSDIVERHSALVSTVRSQLKEREIHVRNLEERAVHLERKIEILQEKNRDLSAEIQEWKDDMSAITNTLEWKLFGRYYAFRRFLLPSGSRRRDIVRSFFRPFLDPLGVLRSSMDKTRFVVDPLKRFGRMVRKSAEYARLLGYRGVKNYIRIYGVKSFIRKVNQHLGRSEAPRSVSDSIDVFPIDEIIKKSERVVLDNIVREESVSLIIPTKDAGPQFHLLLQAFQQQKGIRGLEIVIVDSGSVDDTVNVARRYGANVIEISPHEFSHSRARNIGAEVARKEYLLFTVQDALIPNDTWLYEMLSARERYQVSAVSCAESMRENADLFYKIIAWNHNNFLGVESQDRIMTLPGDRDYESMRKNAQLSDIACLIAKDVFAAYQYRMNYAEDLDLGMRMIKDGHRIAFLNSVRIIHSHNRSPFYFLKRGYVDHIYLADIFDDYCGLQVKPDVLAQDILYSYQVINHLVNHELTAAYPIAEISRIERIIVSGLQSALANKYPLSIDVDNGFGIDAELFSFLQEMSAYYGNGRRDTVYDGYIIAGMLGFMAKTFVYVRNTFERADECLLEDIRRFLWKEYALLCGVHLAYAYLSRDGNVGTYNVHSLHDELVKGI